MESLDEKASKFRCEGLFNSRDDISAGSIPFKTLEEARNTITDAIAKAIKSFKVKNRVPTFWPLECRGIYITIAYI